MNGAKTAFPCTTSCRENEKVIHPKIQIALSIELKIIQQSFCQVYVFDQVYFGKV
jgi:hypothetical protein